MLPCIVIHFFLNSQPHALITQIYSVIKFYMFRESSLFIIRSSLLYIRHWYVLCRFLKTVSRQSQDDSAWKKNFTNVVYAFNETDNGDSLWETNNPVFNVRNFETHVISETLILYGKNIRLPTSVSLYRTEYFIALETVNNYRKINALNFYVHTVNKSCFNIKRPTVTPCGTS
jgi:hypothetical protein